MLTKDIQVFPHNAAVAEKIWVGFKEFRNIFMGFSDSTQRPRIAAPIRECSISSSLSAFGSYT